MNWSHCEDEIKMGEFLEHISDESKLRRFSLELACTVIDELTDKRLIDAVDATEDYLNGMITEQRLKKFYYDADLVLEEIGKREMEDFENGVEDDEMEYEKGLVVLYAAIPPNMDYYDSTLDAARDSALHAAHYCHQVRGFGELTNQLQILDVVGLPTVVS